MTNNTSGDSFKCTQYILDSNNLTGIVNTSTKATWKPHNFIRSLSVSPVKIVGNVSGNDKVLASNEYRLKSYNMTFGVIGKEILTSSSFGVLPNEKLCIAETYEPTYIKFPGGATSVRVFRDYSLVYSRPSVGADADMSDVSEISLNDVTVTINNKNNNSIVQDIDIVVNFYSDTSTWKGSITHNGYLGSSKDNSTINYKNILLALDGMKMTGTFNIKYVSKIEIIFAVSETIPVGTPYCCTSTSVTIGDITIG